MYVYHVSASISYPTLACFKIIFYILAFHFNNNFKHLEESDFENTKRIVVFHCVETPNFIYTFTHLWTFRFWVVSSFEHL